MEDIEPNYTPQVQSKLYHHTSIKLSEEEYKTLKEKNLSMRHVFSLGLLAVDNNQQLIKRISELEMDAERYKRKADRMQEYIHTLQDVNEKEMEKLRKEVATLRLEVAVNRKDDYK